jgi:hypothetical protein
MHGVGLSWAVPNDDGAMSTCCFIFARTLGKAPKCLLCNSITACCVHTGHHHDMAGGPRSPLLTPIQIGIRGAETACFGERRDPVLVCSGFLDRLKICAHRIHLSPVLYQTLVYWMEPPFFCSFVFFFSSHSSIQNGECWATTVTRGGTTTGAMRRGSSCGGLQKD